MKIIARLRRRCAWLQLSTVTLFTLLQRSPAVRVVEIADEYVAASPVGALVKYAAAALASLGAINSMAGATILASSLTPNPTGPLPVFNATVSTPITNLAFTITNTMNIASWTVSGKIPPGLKLEALENTSISLTGPGNLDATTAGSSGNAWGGGATTGNNTTTPVLVGTPTTSGSFTFMLQGFANAGEKGGNGGSFVGTGISDVFSFTVNVTAQASAGPAFTVQPISVVVPGGTVALVAEASNSPTYQWMWNGTTPVSGATNSTLLLTNAAAEVGSYTCVATNSAGSTTSNPATVSIDHTANIGRLVNISCRSTVGTGANILIAGFVVGGAGTTGSESLLIRGSGPALAGFGVAGTLPDPALTLDSSGGTTVASNDGWAGSAMISTTAAAVGAFAWSDTSSHDAALVESLAEGAYTAQIAGESGDTGVALAEIYDATPTGSFTATSPRIVNISARVQVGTGGNILIAGFAIGGTTARTVLIRASGPALVPFGVTGTLADPELQLFSGSNVLVSNTAWAGNAQVATAAASVGAFAWSSAGSADSAILVTLPPGAYTAQVSGASGDTGIALVEVYEVP